MSQPRDGFVESFTNSIGNDGVFEDRGTVSNISVKQKLIRTAMHSEARFPPPPYPGGPDLKSQPLDSARAAAAALAIVIAFLPLQGRPRLKM